MAAFGWSVGDLVKGIEISAKIYHAFADGARNAPRRFRELVNEFGVSLSCWSTYHRHDEQELTPLQSFQAAFETVVGMLQKHKQPIGLAYKDIQDTLMKCQKHLQKYDAMDRPFSSSSPGHAIHKFVLMVKFPFDDPEWDRLRQELAGHTRIINLRIQSLFLEHQIEERIKNMEQRAGIVDIRRMVSDMHQQMRHFSSGSISCPPVAANKSESTSLAPATDTPSDVSLELLGRQAYDTLLRLEQSQLLARTGSEADDAHVETEQLARARKDLEAQNKWLRDSARDDGSVLRTRLLNLEQRLPNVRRQDTYASGVMSATSSQVPSLIPDAPSRSTTSPISIAQGQSLPYSYPEFSLGLGAPATPSDWPSPAPKFKEPLGANLDRRFSASSPPDGIFLSQYPEPRPGAITPSPGSSPQQKSPATFSSRRPTLTLSDWKLVCSNVKVTIKAMAPLSCGTCLDVCDTDLYWASRVSGGKNLLVECSVSHTRLLEHKLPSDHEPVSYVAHGGVSPATVTTVAFNASCPPCSKVFKNTTVCGQVKLRGSSATPIKEGPKYSFANAADHQAFQELVHGMKLIHTFDINQIRTDSGAVSHSESLRIWQRSETFPSSLLLMSNVSLRDRAPKTHFLEPKDSFVPLSKSEVAKDSVKIRLTIARPAAGEKGRRYSRDSLSSSSSAGSMGSAHAGHERPKWIEFQFHTGADRRAFCQCWDPV